MTSANVPGEPMVLRDEDALALGAECYLFHDREIVNRCDDSVVRSFENGTFYIRKSRGHIPVAVDFPFDRERHRPGGAGEHRRGPGHR
jgi:hydrogenase maturation protein HypF